MGPCEPSTRRRTVSPGEQSVGIRGSSAWHSTVSAGRQSVCRILATTSADWLPASTKSIPSNYTTKQPTYARRAGGVLCSATTKLAAYTSSIAAKLRHIPSSVEYVANHNVAAHRHASIKLPTITAHGTTVHRYASVSAKSAARTDLVVHTQRRYAFHSTRTTR